MSLENQLKELVDINTQLRLSNELLESKCEALLEDLSIKEAQWTDKEEKLHAEVCVIMTIIMMYYMHTLISDTYLLGISNEFSALAPPTSSLGGVGGLALLPCVADKEAVGGEIPSVDSQGREEDGGIATSQPAAVS